MLVVKLDYTAILSDFARELPWHDKLQFTEVIQQ